MPYSPVGFSQINSYLRLTKCCRQLWSQRRRLPQFPASARICWTNSALAVPPWIVGLPWKVQGNHCLGRYITWHLFTLLNYCSHFDVQDFRSRVNFVCWTLTRLQESGGTRNLRRIWTTTNSAGHWGEKILWYWSRTFERTKNHVSLTFIWTNLTLGFRYYYDKNILTKISGKRYAYRY